MQEIMHLPWPLSQILGRKVSIWPQNFEGATISLWKIQVVPLNRQRTFLRIDFHLILFTLGRGRNSVFKQTRWKAFHFCTFSNGFMISSEVIVIAMLLSLRARAKKWDFCNKQLTKSVILTCRIAFAFSKMTATLMFVDGWTTGSFFCSVCRRLKDWTSTQRNIAN